MNIKTIANEKLGGYKIKDNAIVIKTCPYCNDSDYSFAYDIASKHFTCEKCNSFGTSDDLKEKFGVDNIDSKQVANIAIIKENMPNVLSIEDADDLIKSYLLRYSNVETLDRNNVIITDGGTKCMLMHLDENKRLKAMKIITSKDNKLSLEYKSDALNSLFNACETKNEQDIIMVYKETDALFLLKLGIKNVVAIANDDNLDFIQEFYDYLKDKRTIILAVPKSYNDKWGQDLTYRLGKHKLFIHEYLGDSILDEYEKSNIEYIESISSIHSIREVKNVTSLDKIDENEYEHIVIATGEEHYDRLLGGTRMGELTILTGTPGSGKSTYLNQLVVKAREKGEGSLLYSGELRSELLKSKIYEVCAGKENLEITKNTFNENITVRKIRNKSITKKIGNWVRDKIHILEYDFMAYDTDILSAIEETYCKKGIRLFILDNLMTIGFKGIGNTDNDKWAAQKRFIIALKHLTKKYPIHIILVAHPKKMEDESKATMYDIHGISEIPNLCDNIIMIRRFTESEREAFAKQKRFIPSVEEKLLKDRFYGRINAKIPIMYDSESGRLHTDNVGPGIRLGWETIPE